MELSRPPTKRSRVDEQPETQRQSGTRMYGEKTAGSNVRLARRTLSIRNFSIPLRPVTFTSQIRLPRSSQQSFTSCTEENSGGNMPQTTVSIHNLSVPLQSVMFTSPEMGLHDAADQQSNWGHTTTSPVLSISQIGESFILQGHGTYSHEASVAAHQVHIPSVDLSVIQTAGETSGDLSTELQAQTTGRSTSEYQTITRFTPQLITAIQDDLTKLSGQLLSKGLITADQSRQLRNLMHTESDRAAKLVDFVLNRLELNSGYYRKFIECLEEDQENNQQILEILNGAYAGDQTNPSGSSNLSKLNEYLLLNIYDPEASETSSDKFPYLPNRKFITLAIIEKEGITRATADGFTKGTLHGHADEIAKKKSPIKIEAVLEPPDRKRQVKCVFIEGAPGIGKSTFALELCRRQKEIESMKMYSLVILLRLREKGIQNIQTVGMVFENICRHDKHLQQCLSEEVTVNGGEKVIFILDGFDELPTHLRNDSFFTELIRGKYLPACTVLVTSRPSASADLLQCIRDYKHVEIIGFTKDDIQQYAESMLNDQPEMLQDFLKYISDNPPIRGMMYIPLNSAIVLEIYKMNRRNTGKHIPQTMTELYTDLCRTLLMKGLAESNHPLANQVSYDTALDDLPKCIKDQVLSLGELAFNGALKQEITFTTLPEGCDDLGFMNISTGLFLGGKSYSFLHLTVQEFLAAYYFSQLPPNEQKMKFICNSRLLNEEESVLVSKWTHLDIMWMFVAGLTGFKNIGWKLVHKANSTWLPSNFNMFIIQCLYELQKGEEIKGICDNLFHEGVPEVRVSTPLNCYLAGYCIAVSGTTWNINCSTINGDEAVEMLSLGIKSISDTDSEMYGSIDCLNLLVSSCTKKSIRHLKNLVPLNFKELNLAHNKLDNCAFDELSTLIPITLKTLSLVHNPGGDDAMVKLLPKLTQLHSLDISEITLGLHDVQALSELLKSTRYLMKLEIGDPYMTEECVSSMVKVLLSPSSLKEVTIHSIKWTTGNTGNFALLESNKNIWALHFRVFHEDFEDDQYDSLNLNPVIPAVAKALHKNDSLIHLGIPPCEAPDIELFDIEHGSVVSLSEMLRMNTTLEHLDVFTPLTCDDIQILVSALQDNDTLEHLHLWNERIVILNPRQ